jgi:transposase
VLKPSYYSEPTDVDRIVFEKLVPADHLLRKVKAFIDFERFRDLVKECYSPNMGRGAEDPVRMIKLEYLQFQYNLSDREVLKRAQVDVSFRYFLDLSLDSELPTAGLMSQFRTRLGHERHQALLNDLVAQARERGLVKDRLRLKDATHVIANIAIPSAIGLVAQTRQRLLAAAQPYAAERVAQEEARTEQIRQVTDDLKDEERLLQRVKHLHQIVAWADELQQALGPAPAPCDPSRQRFDDALALAHRVLEQSDHPKRKDKLLSTTDPDARRGKHGAYYDGYQLNINMDADSELITAVATPPANADEAALAEELIEQEEQAHGNDIQAISMDGVAFQGPVLRRLQAPDGLGLDVYVPPQEWASYSSPYFTAPDFQLVEEGRVCICPAEEESRSRQRNNHDTGWCFRFPRRVCANCPLLDRCMAQLPAHTGRVVTKNDYEAEYQAAWQRASTPEYAQIRHEHPKVERKLAEIVRYHGGRRTRYRGSRRVLIQYLLTAFAVNIKRMLKLLDPHQKVGQPGLALM